MPLGDFVQPGTIPKPLKFGRAGRFIFGAAALYFFTWMLVERPNLIDGNSINIGWLAGILFAFYYLPDLFIVGLSRSWGRWPQAAAVAIAMALLAADFAAYGSGWAPPLGWGVFILGIVFYGAIGPAFLVAAVLAVPG